MTRSELGEKLRGIYPPIPTPLTSEGSIDEKSLCSLVAHLLDGGVHGLWVMGGGGAFVLHTEDEKLRVIRTVVREARGRVPVLAGGGDCGTKKAIENLERVAEAGADAAFVIPPFYFVHDQSELRDYFEEISERAALPFMLYNNPINTQNGLRVETVVKLAKSENILGIKDSSCDYSFFQRLTQALKAFPHFKMFQGGESLVASSFLFGAHGAILGLANAFPRLCVDIYEAAQAKDVDRLITLQERFLSLLQIEDIHENGNDRSFLGGIQTALELMGICSRNLPKPFAPFAETEVRRVQAILNKYGVFDLARTQT